MPWASTCFFWQQNSSRNSIPAAFTWHRWSICISACTITTTWYHGCGLQWPLTSQPSSCFCDHRPGENLFTLNLACVLIITGVYIEKGMGLVVPGFIPGTLGEIYEYAPSFIEKSITIGVWALGALIYTLLLKIAIPVYTGELRFYKDEPSVNTTEQPTA